MHRKRKGHLFAGVAFNSDFDGAENYKIEDSCPDAMRIRIATHSSHAPPEAVMRADRRWFAKHSTRNIYVRDPQPGEAWPPDLELFKLDANVVVIITRFKKSVGRIRRFFNASPNEHGFSDSSLATFLRSRGIEPFEWECRW